MAIFFANLMRVHTCRVSAAYAPVALLLLQRVGNPRKSGGRYVATAFPPPN